MICARLEEKVYSNYFRVIRHIGRIRAWDAARVERRFWDEEKYPPPPEMRHPGPTLLLGSWADIAQSYIRVDRYSYVRGKTIETQSKVRRLRRRREARRYRAQQRAREL